MLGPYREPGAGKPPKKTRPLTDTEVLAHYWCEMTGSRKERVSVYRMSSYDREELSKALLAHGVHLNRGLFTWHLKRFDRCKCYLNGGRPK